MDLAGMVVACADGRLHRFHGYNAHPNHLDRSELLLVADFIDPEFIPRPMTARIQENLDCARVLDDFLFVPCDLCELFRAAVVYAGRVVKVGYGIFLRRAHDRSDLAELIVRPDRVKLLARDDVLLGLRGHVLLGGLGECGTANRGQHHHKHKIEQYFLLHDWISSSFYGLNKLILYLNQNLRLVGAVALAIRLKARVIGSLQIVLNDSRRAVDRANLEVPVQHLVTVLPASRKLQLRIERLELVVVQVGSTMRE
jgi:hypothetical protein